MKNLTLQNFREILSLHDNAISVDDWNDDKLLEAHLGTDLELDSLDIIDMIAEFEIEYGVLIDNLLFDNKMYPSASDADVRTFLKVCNECLK